MSESLLLRSALKKVQLAVFVLFALTASSAWAAGLEVVSHRDKIYDMAMRGNDLYAVGFPGLLLHSADRGAHWKVVDIGTTDALFGIDISADGKGVIVGRSGLVLTTADGGKSWKRQKSGTKEHLFDVDIRKGGKVWAVGHFGTIIHSSDGGVSWHPQQYDATLPALTDEEGTEEQRAQISIAEMENEGAVEEARLNSVCFVSDQEGWIGGEFGLILHTADGGKSWKRQINSAGKLLFSLRALDQNNVVAVGIEGNMIETADGGKTWKTVDTRVSEHLLDFWTVGDRWFVVGRDGVVLVREGKDADFKRMRLGIYAWFGTVRFLDANLGFITGGRGSLLKTTNGGAQWQRLSGR